MKEFLLIVVGMIIGAVIISLIRPVKKCCSKHSCPDTCSKPKPLVFVKIRTEPVTEEKEKS